MKWGYFSFFLLESYKRVSFGEETLQSMLVNVLKVVGKVRKQDRFCLSKIVLRTYGVFRGFELERLSVFVTLSFES